MSAFEKTACKWDLAGGVAVLAALARAPTRPGLPRPSLYDAASAPAEQRGRGLGAGLTVDGTVTAVLYDRVATAADLYHSGKVSKLLLSGDNRFLNYNEPQAMYDAAVSLGVPAEALVLDYAAAAPTTPVIRARAIFGLSRAVLVTQAFHCRARCFLCNSLGLEAFGVVADRRQYQSRAELYWNIREIFATAAAFWDVIVGPSAAGARRPAGQSVDEGE